MQTSQLAGVLGINSPSPEHPLNLAEAGQAGVEVWVKRDDLLHPVVSGNKWRKLKYALDELVSGDKRQVVSFGGGYSNHLHALGYCCHKLQLPLLAVVRGDYRNQLTPTLADLIHWGHQIEFVDRQTYRQRNDPAYLATWQRHFSNPCIIPEGGSQQSALRGCAEIVGELTRDYDYILAPVASGGTLAGLITANPRAQIIGVAMLKGQDYLEKLVNDLLPEGSDRTWQICHDFHFGGYAKCPPELNSFCQQFTAQYDIPVEGVYSGKLVFAACALIRQGFFPHGSRILVLHTGGLQGARR